MAATIHTRRPDAIAKNATAHAMQKSVHAWSSELTDWVSPVWTSGEKKARSEEEMYRELLRCWAYWCRGTGGISRPRRCSPRYWPAAAYDQPSGAMLPA